MPAPVAVLDDQAELSPPPDPEENKITQPLRARDRRPRRTALVVDDSDDIQELCREVLEEEGFLVRRAFNGQDALELLIALPAPQIIVLDILMPEMSGLELLDIIRAYHRLADVPIVVVTATDALDRETAPRVVLLKKPFTCEELARSVQAALKAADSEG